MKKTFCYSVERHIKGWKKESINIRADSQKQADEILKNIVLRKDMETYSSENVIIEKTNELSHVTTLSPCKEKPSIIAYNESGNVCDNRQQNDELDKKEAVKDALSEALEYLDDDIAVICDDDLMKRAKMVFDKIYNAIHILNEKE